MIRTFLGASAGTTGAYAASDNGQMNRYAMRVIEGTPLDPAALQYASEGMNPIWGFVTVVTLTMGPRLADGVKGYMAGVDGRKTRRLEAELGGIIEHEDKDR